MRVKDLIETLEGYDPDSKVVVTVHDPRLRLDHPKRFLFYEGIEVEATSTMTTRYVELQVVVGEEEDAS